MRSSSPPCSRPASRASRTAPSAPSLEANSKENRLTVQTEGAKSREVSLDTEEFSDLRLAYAQHVYKAQGRTVDRAFVLTGGWQTDRERAYVALTRARERTDIYVSREDLGEQGMDTGAIERLGEAMAKSHAQQASIATPTAERESRQPQSEATPLAEQAVTSTTAPIVRARPRGSCTSPKNSASRTAISAMGSSKSRGRSGRRWLAK